MRHTLCVLAAYLQSWNKKTHHQSFATTYRYGHLQSSVLVCNVTVKCAVKFNNDSNLPFVFYLKDQKCFLTSTRPDTPIMAA